MNDFVKEITLVLALAGFVLISTKIEKKRDNFEIPEGYRAVKCEKMEQRGDTIVVKYYFCTERSTSNKE